MSNRSDQARILRGKDKLPKLMVITTHVVIVFRYQIQLAAAEERGHCTELLNYLGNPEIQPLLRDYVTTVNHNDKLAHRNLTAVLYRAELKNMVI